MGSDSIALVLVEQGRYTRQEIGRQLDSPVLGLLPYDPDRARVLSDGEGDSGKRFLRSKFMRAARTTADATLSLAAARRMRLAPRAAPGEESLPGDATPAPPAALGDGWAQAAAYIRQPPPGEATFADGQHAAGEEAGHVR